MSEAKSAYDCAQADADAGPQVRWPKQNPRVDLTRYSAGHLVVRLVEARKFLEEYERALLTTPGAQARVCLINESISTLVEIETRMRRKLAAAITPGGASLTQEGAKR